MRDTQFGPHWDIVDTWIPGATDFIAGSVGPGDTFIGLDEDTAMVGDGRSWEVIGRAKVHVLREGEWTRYAEGDEMAYGAMNAIRRAGLRVPDDIAVIGFDNHVNAELFDLSTISQPCCESSVTSARRARRPVRARADALPLPRNAA